MFAFVIKFISYKAIFTIFATQNLKLEQMYICIAFFYQDIDEKVFIEQTIGQKHKFNQMSHRNKALYELNQLSQI